MLRSIRDPQGLAWNVWAVLPVWLERHRLRDPTTGTERLPLPAEFAGGWLAFESARGERRRVGPLPDGWESLDDPALVRALERATVVEPRPTASLPDAGTLDGAASVTIHARVDGPGHLSELA